MSILFCNNAMSTLNIVILFLRIIFSSETCYAMMIVETKDLIQISSLFKSDISKFFKSDHLLMKIHEDYSKEIQDISYPDHSKSHPMIVRFHENNSDNNDNNNQQNILNVDNIFDNGRTMYVDHQYAIISATQSELQSTMSIYPNLIDIYFPLLPDMKIHKSLRMVFKRNSNKKACFPSKMIFNNAYKLTNDIDNGNRVSEATHTNMYIKVQEISISIRAILNPMESDKDVNSFLTFMNDLIHLYDFQSQQVEFHYSGIEQELATTKQTYIEIKFHSCEYIMKVTKILSKRREVLWIEEVLPVYTHNREANGVCDTGERLNSPLETIANITGSNEIVAIADTGIDVNNCYFYDSSVSVPYVEVQQASQSTVDFQHRKIVQYYYQNSIGKVTDQIDDNSGHGTHVSGIVAGKHILNFGDFHRFRGMASEAKIAFFDLGQTNLASSQDPNAAVSVGGLVIPSNLNSGLFNIMYMYTGARIFSNSWGTNTNNYDVQAQQVDQFMWDHPDALVLFAAGNSGAGNTLNTVGSPATAKNILTIGAAMNTNEEWLAKMSGSKNDARYDISTLAYFSSRGPTQDNRLKPDVVAPGYYVTSAKGVASSLKPFCEVQSLAGTSMSTPVTAGFALKIRQYFILGYYPSGTRSVNNGFIPSGALIKACLIHSSQPLKYISEDVSSNTFSNVLNYPDVNQGYGRIQLSSVLNFASEAGENPINMFVIGSIANDPNTGNNYFKSFTASGQVHTYTITTSSDSYIAQSHPIRITLAFTDYPGNPLLSGSIHQEAMVNQIAITCAGYAAYLTDPTKNTVLAGNVAMIDIMKPVASTSYTITVKCTKFSSISVAQPYALVITGANIYLPNDQQDDYSSDEDTSGFTADKGALPYIIAFSILDAILLALCIFFQYLEIMKQQQQQYDDDDFDDDSNYENNSNDDDDDDAVMKPVTIFSLFSRTAVRNRNMNYQDNNNNNNNNNNTSNNTNIYSQQYDVPMDEEGFEPYDPNLFEQ